MLVSSLTVQRDVDLGFYNLTGAKSGTNGMLGQIGIQGREKYLILKSK